jgi:flagellar basal-body rod protein FlgF
MEPGLYVGLSGQLALQKRLDTIAGNVANSSTTGFRAENVTFQSVLSRQSIAYSDAGQSTYATTSGPVSETGNPLDIAVEGDAFLAISTAAGTVLTRDGRMRISPTGDLETIEGNAILDAGGSPLRVNPALGAVQIARNGAISQKGNEVGTIGLFRIPADATITRGPGSGFISDKPGEPVVDFRKAGVLQGHLEGANVNPVLEMTRLIAVSRAFDSISQSMDQSDRKLTDAIHTLGEGRR